MAIKKIVWLLSLMIAGHSFAQEDGDGLGQIIQIDTHLKSFVGKPSWTLIIRDVDNGQNIPYLFDFKRGFNHWVAITYSNNYLISASRLQFSPYRRNPYIEKRINNFCQLESRGHINRGISMHIIISGSLTPNSDTFTCQVLRYPTTHFTVVNLGIS